MRLCHGTPSRSARQLTAACSLRCTCLRRRERCHKFAIASLCYGRAMHSKLKAMLLAMPYSALLAGYYLNHAKTVAMRGTRARDFLGVPNFAELDLSSVKTSDTVFILGSGASINNISDEGWANIAKHDSFGFNFWLIHKFVPTLYFSEALPETAPGFDYPRLYRRYVDAAALRPEYAHVPKVLTDFTIDRAYFWKGLPEHMKENVYSVATIPAFARTESEFRRNAKELKRLGVFKQKSHIRHLFKYRATISMLVSLAYMMGYKRIVLCGVDITDPRYFYHDADRYPQFKEVESARPGKVHITGVEREMMVTAQTVIQVLNEVVLQPDNVELLVENPQSALSSFLRAARASDLG